MRLFLLTFIAILSACATPRPASGPPQLEEVWRLTEGLDRPESVVLDAARDVLYISSIRGGGAEQDGNGFISRASLDGEMVEAEWVAGLNAPKGLALDGDRLWIADIHEVVEVDVASGEVVQRHAVEGALFLNDVALAPDGTVFVSDTQTSRVHRVRDRQVEVWLEGGFASPNGLLVERGVLSMLADEEGAEGNARRLRSVDIRSRSIETPFAETATGRLDALQSDGRGGSFQTDWREGRVYHVGPDGTATVLAEMGPGTADLAYVSETAMLYLPVMEASELVAYRVVW